MTIPRGERPLSGWPVVIFNHGFIPPNQYKTTERYIAYQDGFASHDYIVFRSDYRGHGNSEGGAVGGYSSPAYTIDVLNALASVKRYPDADPSRIGMWGHSMGGQITLRAMVVSKDIKAGVIWGGVVGSYPDLLEHWRRPTDVAVTLSPTSGRGGRWRADLITIYGSPDDNPGFWAAISPNSYLRDLSGPVQLHHSTTDESVPFVLSELLYAEILAVGVPVEFYVYEGDDHDITANFVTAMQRSVDFFDTYVKGDD
jgi:dipeptidyl aminopeptidase/acylaminoacyl peptidase